jgi:hypothetical protein
MKAKARAQGAMDVLDAGAFWAWTTGRDPQEWFASDPAVAAMFRHLVLSTRPSEATEVSTVEVIRTTVGDVAVT